MYSQVNIFLTPFSFSRLSYSWHEYEKKKSKVRQKRIEKKIFMIFWKNNSMLVLQQLVVSLSAVRFLKTFEIYAWTINYFEIHHILLKSIKILTDLTVHYFFLNSITTKKGKFKQIEIRINQIGNRLIQIIPSKGKYIQQITLGEVL